MARRAEEGYRKELETWPRLEPEERCRVHAVRQQMDSSLNDFQLLPVLLLPLLPVQVRSERRAIAWRVFFVQFGFSSYLEYSANVYILLIYAFWTFTTHELV